jgi:hypothetical protein
MEISLTGYSLLLNFVLVVLVVVPTGFAVHRSLLKQKNEELESLARTRGEALHDRDERIESLELRVEHLEGMMEAIQRIKSEEIAVEVVRLLKGESNGLV